MSRRVYLLGVGLAALIRMDFMDPDRLCRGLENPPPARTGRRQKPMADIAFACVFKVFTSRRFQCDLDDALKVGYRQERVDTERRAGVQSGKDPRILALD